MGERVTGVLLELLTGAHAASQERDQLWVATKTCDMLLDPS